MATLPKLSVAFTAMVSDPAVPSVSLSVARSLFNSLSEPVMVRCVRCCRRPPVADSTPLLSLSFTVNVSPLAAPSPPRPRRRSLSPRTDRLRPRHRDHRRPVAVTAIVFAVATLPKLSSGFTAMVSEPRPRRRCPSASPGRCSTSLSETSIKVVVVPLLGGRAVPPCRRQQPIAVAHRHRKVSPLWRRSPPR